MKPEDHYGETAELLGKEVCQIQEIVKGIYDEVTAGRSGTFRGEKAFPDSLPIDFRVVVCLFRYTQGSDPGIARNIRQLLPESSFSEDTKAKVLDYLPAEITPSRASSAHGGTTVFTPDENDSVIPDE